MKLGFISFVVLAYQNVEACYKDGQCLIRDLDGHAIKHYKRWDCSSPIIEE